MRNFIKLVLSVGERTYCNVHLNSFQITANMSVKKRKLTLKISMNIKTHESRETISRIND